MANTIRLSTAAPLRGDTRWHFIERAKTIRLASQSGDDPIYVSPLWYTVDERRIFMPIDQASRHRKNMEQNGRFSAAIDEGEEFATAAGVVIEGHAKPVEELKFAQHLMAKVLDKYFYPGHPYLQEYIEFGDYYGRQFIELVSDRTIGFDLRAMTSMPTLEKRYFPENGG